MGVHFTKMSGTGNDFIVIDNRGGAVGADLAQFASAVCPRRTGVGADGVLLIEPSEVADFRMRILNADGSEPEMCGNGARCAARFAFARGIAPAQMRMETGAGPIRAEVDERGVAIGMGEVPDVPDERRLEAGGATWEVHPIEAGVPHAIIFTDDLEGAPLESAGPAVRWHEFFQPRGTNVDFVRVTGPRSIAVRTYERGVEAETLACGTGAVASAVITYCRGRIEGPPVEVRVPGGRLRVEFEPADEGVREVRLSGDAEFIYEAELLQT